MLLSQLNGLDFEIYQSHVLPSILEQIESCDDKVAQQYLMEVRLPTPPASHSRYLFVCRLLMFVLSSDASGGILFACHCNSLHLQTLHRTECMSHAAAAHHQHAWRPLSYTGTTRLVYTQIPYAAAWTQRCRPAVQLCAGLSETQLAGASTWGRSEHL
jgi:hypothetical protein